MLLAIFILATLWAGLAAALPMPLPWNLWERGYAGLALGPLLATFLLLGGGLAAGRLDGPVVAASAAILLAAGTVPWLSQRYRRVARRRLRESRADFRRPAFWVLQGLVGLAAVALAILFARTLFVSGGDIRAATGGVSSDWNLHLQQIAGFAYGANFPPQFIGMVGQHLSYPFGINLFGAALAVTGLSAIGAAKVSSWLLAVAGVGCLASLLRQLGGIRAALIGTPLYYLLGGLAFLTVAADIATHGPGSFWAHLPHLYTYTDGPGGLGNLQLANVTFAAVQPQRAFVFGLPLVLMVISLLAVGLQPANRHRRRPFLAAGVVAGLLPIIHTHGLIFLAILVPVWAALSLGRGRTRSRAALATDWAVFAAAAVIVAGPQLAWLTGGTHNALGWLPGWLHGHDSVWWFWLKNYGLFLPLALLAAWFTRGPVRQLLLASLAVFLAANLVVFQSSAWDNTKIFFYAAIGLVAGVAVLLARLSRRRFGWPPVLALLGLMIVAGTLDVLATVRLQRQTDVLFSGNQIRMAQDVRTASDSRSVFLTASEPNNEFTSLAGRRAVLSGNWYTTFGIPTAARQRDIAELYRGGPDFESLRARYGIRYVVIGPAERAADSAHSINDRFFEQRFAVWRDYGSTTIYDLQQPTP